jgi:phosphoserine aminotransferase
VLFLQGGASQQFAQIPLNLLPETALPTTSTPVSGRRKPSKKLRATATSTSPPPPSLTTTSPFPARTSGSCRKTRLRSLRANETIGGLEFDWVPETGDVPLVADMSSDILSRPIDVSRSA